MDNLVTAKYFQISPKANGVPEFLEFLAEINELDLAEREIDIAWEGQSPVIVRLESLQPRRRGFHTGELVRKQVDNIPPEANDEGLTPIELSDGGGLAYSSAFSFHEATSTLLIQSNPIAVPHTRLRRYLEDRDETAQFDFEPVVKENAWERFNDGTARKLALRLASPRALPQDFGQEAGTVGGAAASVAEALGAPYISIEVSMGTKKGSLARAAVRRIIRTFQRAHRDEEADVRVLNASVKSEEGGTDVIDFLDEFLIFRDTFDLPADNPDRNLAIRANALLGNHQMNLPYLSGIYGDN